MEDHANPQFLNLTTTGWKSGKQHKIEIWFVEYDSRYYIMSETFERAHWVQNIIREPRVLFSLKNESFEGTARIVNTVKEPQLSSDISKLMSSKEVDGLIVELKHN
ncbi:MAG: nitroreductase family deazaflavin-dependent oxidoreductase [Nitrosopumilus sp.]|nr:nitroreductase family deazaflavin-dependent oxidoreductase [Nitrosopumilus sp.]